MGRLWKNLKPFLALSRTPHALLDMATPAVAALLWSGGFPSPRVILLGLVTSFAGYTAVYALNDVMDYPNDRLKVASHKNPESRRDIDTFLVRHPMALGVLPFAHGVIWTSGWAIVALVGAYVLRPVCAIIFLCACVLEAVYCCLLRVSHLRVVISGMVKSSGAIAGVFVVDPTPDPLFLAHLFGWLFVWEVGGQNIPNDWADLSRDEEICAKTLPWLLGPQKASWIVLSCLILGSILGALLPLSARNLPWPQFLAFSVVAGGLLLIHPSLKLLKLKTPAAAAKLFNTASYYPLAMLISVVMTLSL